MKTLAKKNYQHPAIEIIKVEYSCTLLDASEPIPSARQVSNERRNEDYDD